MDFHSDPHALWGVIATGIGLFALIIGPVFLRGQNPKRFVLVPLAAGAFGIIGSVLLKNPILFWVLVAITLLLTSGILATAEE